MTVPFVSELRVGSDVITLGGGDGAVLHLRVALRVDAPGSTPFSSVKDAALASFFPSGMNSGEFVGKVRGFEILDESDSLDACGIRDGSTILLARRRRRAVR